MTLAQFVSISIPRFLQRPPRLAAVTPRAPETKAGFQAEMEDTDKRTETLQGNRTAELHQCTKLYLTQP